MPLIQLTTYIKAPAERVFNISRSINFHAASMAHTNEKAIAGRTSGLIENGETVTWQARHLFLNRKLQVQITAMQPYSFFKDEMLKGDFKVMKHEHFFSEHAGITTMTDNFYFQSPGGLAGRLINALFLTRYMTRLLDQRNKAIKQYAETDAWKEVIF